MIHTITLRIQPETGRPFNLMVELDAKSIGDALKKVAEDADRYDRGCKDFKREG